MFTKERIRAAAIVLVAGLAFAYMADWSPEKPDVMPGLWHDGHMKPANDFTLPLLDGGTLTLSDLRGQIVVLNLWATWCAPCLEETPDLVAVQERFRSLGVQVVGLSVDGAGWEVVRPFAERFAVNYPIILDDGVAADSYEGYTAVPTTYLINREGLIWRYMPGPLSAGELAEALQVMLQAEPV